MKVKIHPEASKRFNSRATQLIKILDSPNIHPGQKQFQPELHIDGIIERSDIKEGILKCYNDIAGNEISRYYETETESIGLDSTGFKKFLTLCEEIQKRKELNEIVSIQYVKNIVFEWLIQKHYKKIKKTVINFLLDSCKNDVKEHEIWIPIAKTYIEEQIQIGNVIFKELNKVTVDSWYEYIIQNKDENQTINDIDKYFNREIRKLQGHMIAIIKINAEPIRASEIAFIEVEQSLNLIRFFVPANFHPTLFSHSSVLGKENIQTTEFHIIQNDHIEASSKKIENQHSLTWSIKKDLIIQMKEAISIFNDLLLTKEKTEFQKLLLKSLNYYSKSSLTRSYSEKLVYILVALESILLKNLSEPIQQNIGERVAFTISDDGKERKKIVKNFKDIYDIRSKYIHHGYEISTSNFETFRYFLKNSWNFFRVLIMNYNYFKNKLEMIDKIEERKYSGV